MEKRIRIDGKILKALSNSDNGEVGAETLFRYHEDDASVWAEYSGGRIVRGTMVGVRLSGNTLDLRYQHVSADGKIKTGICLSTLSLNAQGKLTVAESWKWTCDDHSQGQSVLVEA
jgi:hypothetical protein